MIEPIAQQTLASPELQRPDLNIESVTQSLPVKISKESLPWIADEQMDIPTVQIQTTEGIVFRFGSAVKGNGTLEKIASQVPANKSKTVEEAMFKSLPELFEGNMPNVVDRHVGTEAEWPIFKVSKRGPDSPRLFFTWFRAEDGIPVALKLAVASHKRQHDVMNVVNYKIKGLKR